MPRYQYKVVPAPAKGLKGKGIKGAEARFSNALELVLNDLASAGWEYQRAETLPSTERSGLTGSTTDWRNVLVFRRVLDDTAEASQPELLAAPAAALSPPADPAQRPQDGALAGHQNPLEDGAEGAGHDPNENLQNTPKSDT